MFEFKGFSLHFTTAVVVCLFLVLGFLFKPFHFKSEEVFSPHLLNPVSQPSRANIDSLFDSVDRAVDGTGLGLM